MGDRGEVQLWSRQADDAEVDEGSLDLLDEAELARAGRFRGTRDRARYVSHHVFTRRVLARYLGIGPAAVRIHATAQGKPMTTLASGIEFNTSRSGGLSLVAVARSPVGVDVERLRRIDDALEVADGSFSDLERRRLGEVAHDERDWVFLQLWTRKESVVKAFGVGLSVPLASVEVQADEGTPGTPFNGRFGTDPFVVAGVEVPAGWIAAVCMPGSSLSVRTMDAATLPP